jgi:hypothetical protein
MVLFTEVNPMAALTLESAPPGTVVIYGNPTNGETLAKRRDGNWYVSETGAYAHVTVDDNRLCTLLFLGDGKFNEVEPKIVRTGGAFDPNPTHKSYDSLGRMTSYCYPGYNNIATRWDDVTCPVCLEKQKKAFEFHHEHDGSGCLEEGCSCSYSPMSAAIAICTCVEL